MEDGGASVQRMLYVCVSAVDGCCSVLARQRLGEKEGGERKDATQKEKRKSEMRKRNDARLQSFSQSKMHGVSPKYRASDAAVSLHAGPGRLAEEQRQNEKLEHQVPPTGYSHTDTCRNCMESTVITARVMSACNINPGQINKHGFTVHII